MQIADSTWDSSSDGAWGRQFVSKNLGWRLNLCWGGVPVEPIGEVYVREAVIAGLFAGFT